MSVICKLITEHHLEFLSLKGGCRGSSESTHVKMPHCWKSHVMAQLTIQALSRENHILLHANIKSEKQAAHPHSLMRAFVIISLKSVIAKLAIYLNT